MRSHRLIAVLALALGLRLFAVIWLADTVPYSDYFYYHEAGRLQAADPGFFFRASTVREYAKLSWWPPGYPAFLGALYTLFGDSHRVAVYVQALLGTLVCGLVYVLARRAAGERTALAAGILLAVDPTYIFTTNLLASENLFVVWLALAAWFAGRDPSPRSQILAGATLALGALTRAVGLTAIPVVLLWQRRRHASRRTWLRSSAWLAGACALVLAPWTLRNAVVAGSPALVCFGGGLNFYYGHNDGGLEYRDVSQTPMAGLGDAAAIDRKGYALGWSSIAADPPGFFARGARKIVALFSPPTPLLHANSAVRIAPGNPGARIATGRTQDILLHGFFAVLAAVHTYVLLAGTLAALVAWPRLPAELRLAAWLVLAWIAVHVLYWAQPRFRYPMEVPMALLAGWVLARFETRDTRQSRRKPAAIQTRKLSA